jgi:hypothetical protein
MFKPIEVSGTLFQIKEARSVTQGIVQRAFVCIMWHSCKLSLIYTEEHSLSSASTTDEVSLRTTYDDLPEKLTDDQPASRNRFSSCIRIPITCSSPHAASIYTCTYLLASIFGKTLPTPPSPRLHSCLRPHPSQTVTTCHRITVMLDSLSVENPRVVL